MKAYGKNEYVGLHHVYDDYPDKADLQLLGDSLAVASKNATRKLQRKTARNIAKREIRASLLA